MIMNNKVTMQQIADKLNISKVTVSKALSGKDGVGQDMREKIKATAELMGYSQPAPRTDSSFGIVGVLVTEVFFEKDENFYSRLFKNLYNSAIDDNLFLILNKVSVSAMSNLKAPPVCECDNLRGIIVLGQMSLAYTEFLASLKLPLVLVDYYYQGLKADCVTTDNLYAMYNATNYLYDHGHRKIGFLGNPRQTSSIQDRYLGYCKSLLEHELPIVPEYNILERNDDGEQVEIVLPEDMPTAFACNSDQAAARLCRKLKRAGYRVPEDVSIIGFDNVSHGTMMEPALTTVNVNRRDMAKNAVDVLLRRIKNPTADARNIICRANIIERDSIKTIE